MGYSISTQQLTGNSKFIKCNSNTDTIASNLNNTSFQGAAGYIKFDSSHGSATHLLWYMLSILMLWTTTDILYLEETQTYISSAEPPHYRVTTVCTSSNSAWLLGDNSTCIQWGNYITCNAPCSSNKAHQTAQFQRHQKS